MSYDAQIATALRMIDAKGGPVTLRGTRHTKPVAGTDRPAVAPTKLTASPNAVILPVARKYIGADLFGDGTLITTKHRMALVAGAAVPWLILQGDTMDAEGDTFRIGALNTLRVDPSGAVILYTLFLKT